MAPHYLALQRTRRAEVRSMSPEVWQNLLAAMRRVSKLPKPRQHFEDHGQEFEALGVSTQHQLERLFAEHLHRSDLASFTYVSTQKGTQYRHWALVGMDNGVVALYNCLFAEKGRQTAN